MGFCENLKSFGGVGFKKNAPWYFLGGGNVGAINI